MSRRTWTVAAVVLALLGGSAAFLAHTRAHQRLGKPGVKVGPVPMFGVENTPRGTNSQFFVSSNSVILPERVLDFTSQGLPIARVVYDWLPKDTVYGQRVYRAPDGFELQNNVVLMGGDRTSIHQPQYCLTGQGFQILKSETDTVRIARPDPYDLPVVKLTAARNMMTKDGRNVSLRAVYVYWFVADGEITADHSQRMWWMARDLVRKGVLQRWAYVTYLVICPPGQEDTAYERVKHVIATAVPEFQLTTGAPLKGASAP